MEIAFCDCPKDGYCPRYQREMRGRFRELCRGENVDPGTAAAFRSQWAREAGPPSQAEQHPPTPLLLKTIQAPGDAVVMTAAIYSLHRAHPGRYTTAVESLHPDVFAHNLDVVPASSNATELYMHYPAVCASNDRGVHFMQGWCEHLEAALGVRVPLMTDRPQLYFPDPNPPVEDFWVVCSGGKRDFTAKLWPYYQEVVVLLRGKVRFIQVGSNNGMGDLPHVGLDGAECAVGKTSLRQLFDMVRRSRGVLCGVSLLMHVAAALGKPAIVIAGGREPVQWNAYPKQHYIHTVGAMPCRSWRGQIGEACWRSRTVPLGDGTFLDRDTCERPVHELGSLSSPLPQCMTLIKPAEVAQRLLQINSMIC